MRALYSELNFFWFFKFEIGFIQLDDFFEKNCKLKNI
jgi:hypothetical protein